MDEDIIIEVEQPEPIEIDLTDKIVLKYVEPDHKKLDNLDYEQAGHTGFTPGRLNLLDNVSNDISNDRLHVVANVGDRPSKLTVTDLQKRIIRTSDEIPNDLQVGQYLLLKKNEMEED